MLNRLRRLTSASVIWPKIDVSFSPLARSVLRGKVLNAGAGWRPVEHLVDGEVTNQDLRYPDDKRTNIHIFSPLHEIPRPDGFFDCILCTAVLEHVANPIEIVAELYRVTKPGGYAVVGVPFLQPEHKVPTDFQRYTKDGLCLLLTNAGYVVEEARPVFTVYHTLHWIVWEWLHLKNTLLYKALRVTILPVLVWRTRRSTLQSEKLASSFHVVARKA